MPQIIASTYEIERRLASGGGGIVYLARHLRLGKQVVLKADKRTVSAGADVLRREVDALKNLSHTYIPQVYDFFVEDGTVYTVMDYIEGESLDIPLKRGERFSQAQIIRWACQLLEALCYLHSRPPHGILHSDIKPANIMVTPEDNICLIDFNIALALGEKGAVRVGFSRGYASPEHYGVDYSAINATEVEDEDLLTRVSVQCAETMLPGETRYTQSAQTSERTVLLDVRSDIYSLGATLYHLLTGKRPAQDASSVEPITDPLVSDAVKRIIQKAMEPNPELRYQTARDMLQDFLSLHENDPRTKKHKRQTRTAAILCGTMLLLGGIATFTGLKQMEHAQEEAVIAAEAAKEQERLAKEAEAEAKEAEQAAKTALELIGLSNQACAEGDVQQAIDCARQAAELDTQYNHQAQLSLTQALGVYDLGDGYVSHMLLELSGTPLKAVLSPSGERAAIMTSGELHIYELQTGEELDCLPMQKSALADMVFLTEDVLLYAAENALRAYDFVQQKELWCAAEATMLAVSGDLSTAAAINPGENVARIYDVAAGTIRKVVTFEGKTQAVAANSIFADPEDDIFTLNADGTRLAVSFSDGSLEIFDLQDSAGNAVVLEASPYTHFEGGFSGNLFAFAAAGDGESVYAAVNLENMTQLGGFTSTMPFHTQSDESGFLLSLENVLVSLDPVSGQQTEIAYTTADIKKFQKNGAYTILTLEDGSLSFFGEQASLLRQYEQAEASDMIALSGEYAIAASLNAPQVRVLRLENHRDAQLMTYDPTFSHDEARVSDDGSTTMLFRYDRFRLYAGDGTQLCEVELPDAQQVYDQQYRRDQEGSRLEVIYNSGLVRTYSAVDGSLLSEEQGEKPEESLYEEFTTDSWRITSPLHGTPEVYDLESGEQIATLEPDAYLTYVTQVGEYVITEYLSSEGERYGILLDDQCRALAYLPGLCDITEDGALIFDDRMGNLRESRIYSMQELLAFAR